MIEFFKNLFRHDKETWTDDSAELLSNATKTQRVQSSVQNKSNVPRSNRKLSDEMPKAKNPRIKRKNYGETNK